MAIKQIIDRKIRISTQNYPLILGVIKNSKELGIVYSLYKIQKCILQTYVNRTIPKINRKCISSMVPKRQFPPNYITLMLPPVPHQSLQMWSRLRPLFTSPSFHCKERNHSASAFSTKHPSPLPSPPNSRQGHTGDHALQPNPNCECVCLHFSPPDMKKETKWVFVLSACEWSFWAFWIVLLDWKSGGGRI